MSVDVALAHDYSEGSLSLARRVGAEPYLDAVWDLTGALFPMGRVDRLEVASDPEISGMNLLCLTVEFPRSSAADALRLRRQWSRQIFNVCPASIVNEFQLAFEWVE